MYTTEMSKGNVPASKTELGYDKYLFDRGSVTVNNDEVVYGMFEISREICVYIFGTHMRIVQILANNYTCEFDSSKREEDYKYNKFHKWLEKDKTDRILNRDFPDCKIWEIFKARMIEILDEYYKDKM